MAETKEKDLKNTNGKCYYIRFLDKNEIAFFVRTILHLPLYSVELKKDGWHAVYGLSMNEMVLNDYEITHIKSENSPEMLESFLRLWRRFLNECDKTEFEEYEIDLRIYLLNSKNVDEIISNLD